MAAGKERIEPELAAAGERVRRTSPLELLWDLVFAFAVTQVSALLARDLTWPGLGRALLVMALVWWAWSAFVWVANAEDPDSLQLRVVLLVATPLIFICALALPHAYGSAGVVFATAYVCVRLLHLALYWDGARRGHASGRAIAGFSATVVVGMLLLIVGAIAGGIWLIVLWIVAAAIDYAGPGWVTRKQLRGLQQVAVEHFAERYSLFIIICLGESIIGVGVAASGHALDGGLVAAATLMLLITIGLWWAYFNRLASEAEAHLRSNADPVLAAADSYSYIHLLLVAGIIVFAAGARTWLGHIDEALALAPAAAMLGGIALYLVGRMAFQRRLVGRLRRSS